jgi:hypothetical protein
MANVKIISYAKFAETLESTGHISTISVSADGNQFQFDLVNKKKDRSSFILSSANLESFAPMAALVLSSYMFGKKIHVQSETNEAGLPFVLEIRVGAKPENAKFKRAAIVAYSKGASADGIAVQFGALRNMQGRTS